MADAAESTDPRTDIDRKQLRAVTARFRAISAARLERVRGMLPERHRQFIDLLPLLLHANHPALPGYVSQSTPCGIPGYKPAASVLTLARRLARSFNHHAGDGAGVHAVYLMGSSGTLGHSGASDIDIWICYPEELDAGALTLLQRKADLLGAWARELGLEAHLFLMNGEKFRRGQREPLTGENCGSAQHYLLLDEFYRTGILLAGRMPAWWLVPPDQEVCFTEYTGELTTNRHVRDTDLVDFGGIHGVPAGEFVGAGIWQLYKAIDSPYKSVLKLLLFEVYAARFPEPVCLSADYKRAVYRGISDIDELDPYVMIYRRLEDHLLAAGQQDRLELVRRALYYKAAKKLSRAPQHGTPSWQRLLMERLVETWGWGAAKLAMLDSRSAWNIHEVGTERNALVKELTYSYRFLSEFARDTEASASIDAREFSILGRKLYAAYERKAGKIENLNPGAAANVAEGELSICAVQAADAAPGEPLWGAYTGLVASRGHPEGRALRQSTCLAEVLAWCVLNGVIGERTRLSVRESQDGLRHAEVDAMLREVREHLSAARTAAALDDSAFATQARPLAMLVFVNVAADPMASREHGVQRVSSRTDSLGFSALRENLVLNIETVVCNSWGETIAHRYTGEDGLIRCLRDYLPLLRPLREGTGPIIAVRSFCASRAGAIATRVDELFDDLGHCLDGAGAADGARYVLAIRDRLHLLELRAGLTTSATAGSTTELLDLLGAPRREWSRLALDRYALRDTPLPALCPLLAPGRVSVFAESGRDSLRVIVADEHGSLFRTAFPGAREHAALAALAQFLVSVRYRQNGAARSTAEARIDDAPRFFRLARTNTHQEYTAQAMPAPAGTRSGFLHVQAIAERGEGERVLYTVYCEGLAFSERELGTAFHEQLAAHIRALRPSGEDYPVYITDLDLSAMEPMEPLPLQTLHYLQHKRLLEGAINGALAR